MIPKANIKLCKKCTLKKQYYSNKKIKAIYNCKYFKQRLYFCKECGSIRIVWDNHYINCEKCGLVHGTAVDNADSIIEDFPTDWICE